MELRQLKSLCLIARHGSIKEAAKRSFLTSSAVSLQIKELERELGVKLFQRTARRLVLTPRGETFYGDARKILESVDEAAEKMKSRSEEFSGKVSLAAPACLRHFYLPAIARFHAAYPTIRLTMYARNHIDASSMVQSGEADLGMGLFEHPVTGLDEIPLVAPKLTLIIPNNHMLASKKRVGWRELSEYPLVILQPATTTRRVIDSAFRRKDLAVKLGMEASTCTEIKRYVVNNIGIGMIHNICLEPEDAARFHSINVDQYFSHPQARLVFRHPKTMTPAAKRLVEFLRFAS